MDSSGTMTAIEFKKFHDFHVFVLEETTQTCSAKSVFYNWGKEPKKNCARVHF